MDVDVLVSVAPLPTWVQREEEILAANEHAAAFFGVESVSALVGTSAIDYVPAGERERALARNRRVLGSGEPADALRGQLIDEQGTRKHGRFAAAPVRYEGDPAIFVIAQDITDRVHRGEELETLTDRLEIALEGTSTGIWEWDLDTDEPFWDEQTRRLFGYQEGAFEGTARAFRDRVHPADVDRVRRAFATALEEGQYDVEFRVDVPEGTPRWLNASGEVVSDDGAPDRMVGIVTDITERKERERRLRRYRQAVENSQDMLAAVDTDYEYLFANQQYRTFHGMADAESVTGIPLADVFEGEELATVTTRVDRAFEGDAVSYEMHRTDSLGDKRILDINYYPLAKDGNTGGVAVAIQDITERTERENALQRERDRFSALFEYFPEPTAAVSFEDDIPRLQAVNPAFESVFGYEAAAIIGESVNDLIVPDEYRGEAARLDERTKEGDPIDREVERLTADGPQYFLLRNISVPGDSETGHYAVYVDIDEQKRRERELERQNERLDEFASVVSHDLRNPLNVAKSRATLVTDDCESAHLDHLRSALERIERITEDTLTLARQGETVGSPESVRLPDVVRTSWEMVDTGEATVEVEETASLRADADRLSNLFENLFRNAIQHVGTDVSVRVGRTEDVLYVADDGPGIPASEQATVFDPGYSTDAEGTGFGLAIVRRIADAHGWSAHVTNGERGARFEFENVDFVD